MSKNRNKPKPMDSIISNQATTEARHLQEWNASCIPTSIIERNFRSYFDPREVDQLLNFNSERKWKHSEHLVPGWGVSGVDPKSGERCFKGAQYKPDHPLKDPKTNRPRKYISPLQTNPIAPLPGDGRPSILAQINQRHRSPHRHHRRREKGRQCSGSKHPPVYPFPGVTTGGKRSRLRRELTYFCKYGRTIYLAFDRDIITKPAVFRALHT